jgi:hypothetical protein
MRPFVFILPTLVVFILASTRNQDQNIYTYGIVPESESHLSLKLAYQDGLGKDLDLSLTRHENLIVKMNLICFYHNIDQNTCKDMINLYRIRMIDPHLDSTPLHLRVPRNLFEANLTGSQVQSMLQFINVLSPKLCYNHMATLSLRSKAKQAFTQPEWLHWKFKEQSRVLVDDHDMYVPCDEMWYMPGGQWLGVPLYSHDTNNRPVAVKCSSSGDVVPYKQMSECTPRSSFSSTCSDDYLPLCVEYISRQPAPTSTASSISASKCLMYSFGIAGHYAMEDYFHTHHHCEVHGFDPTYRSTRSNPDGMYFHLLGLGEREGSSTGSFDYSRRTIWGDFQGEMYTLKEISSLLGHGYALGGDSSGSRENHQAASRPLRITVLKMDCEGCEWKALHDMATLYPELLSDVCTIIIEIHISTTTGFATTRDLEYFSSFWDQYIVTMGFRFSYVHVNSGGPFAMSQVHPVLVELGLRPDACCYELALHRLGCVNSCY